MGNCVTNTQSEITPDTVRNKNSIKSTNSSDIRKDTDNTSDIGLQRSQSQPKIQVHNVEIAYDTSTLTDNTSMDERKYTSTDSEFSNKSPRKYPLITTCWTIGCNKMGAQGNGAARGNLLKVNKMTTLPENIRINNIISGNCGSTYLVCNNYNKLYVWGYNEYGSVAMNDIVIKKIIYLWSNYKLLSKHIFKLLIRFTEELPALTHPLKPVCINCNQMKHLSTGISAFHKFLLLNDNRLYAIGKNGWGQFGIKHNEYRNINNCIKINYFQKNNINIKQIACSLTYSMFLTKSGQLFSCGKAIYGGLGLGKHIPWMHKITPINGLKHKIINVQCGERHTIALTDDRKVLSWGYNNCGQLGHGNTKNVFEPKLIRYIARRNIRIRKIACGGYHNVLLDNEGHVWCFGRNYAFECGNGTCLFALNIPTINYTLRNIKIIDIKCGFQHNVAKTKHSEFYLWGINDFNQCLVLKNDQHFVKIPTKYKRIDGITHWLTYKIIDIYTGWKETRIVTVKLKGSYL
eukprot:91448_1